MARRNTTKGVPRKSGRVRLSPVTLNPNKQREALAKLLAKQGVKPVEDFDRFLAEVGDVWPEHESVDEFILDIRENRRQGAGLRSK